MSTSSLPRANLTILGGSQPQQNAAQKVLIRAQQLATGTATAGQLYTDVDRDTLVPLVGRGSMALDAYDALQEGLLGVARVDMIVEDDPTGTAAVGKFTFGGTATEAKTLKLGVGSSRNGIIEVAVAVGDDGDAICAKANTAADLLLDMVATADVNGTNTDELDITANNEGVDGNDIGLKVYNKVAGVTVTITGMATGSGTISTRDLAAVVGNQRYQKVVQPASYPVTDITTNLLDERFNVDNKLLDGIGLVCDNDTASNIVTTLGSINSQNLIYLATKPTSDTSAYVGPSEFETPMSLACIVAGVMARRLTDDARLTDIIDSTAGNKDGRGGAALASLPLFNTVIPSLEVTPTEYGFNDTEVVSLNEAGGSVVGSNDAGSAMVLGEMYTTYLTNLAGDADDSFKFANYQESYRAVREYFFNNIKADFRQHRLTNGDLLKGRKIANEDSIRSAFKQYYVTLSTADYALTQAGDDAIEYFEDNLVLDIDYRAGTVDFTADIPMVSQLREFNGSITFRFSVN